MTDTLIGLAHNLALLLALVFGYGFLRRFLPATRPLWQWTAYAVLFATGAVLAMLMPIPVADEVLIDNRIAVVALAAPFAGGATALVTVLAAVAMRYGMGGVGTWPGIASLLCATALGWAVSRRWSLARGNLRWPQLVLLGLGSVVVTLPWTFALPEPVDAGAVFRRMALPVILVFPLAISLIGTLLLVVDRASLLDRHLATSERRFRQLVENAPDAILMADPESGTILEVNAHACDLLGRSREDLVGSHQSLLHPPEDVEQVRTVFRRHVSETREGAFTNPVRVDFIRPDGTRVPVEGIAGMFDFDGRPALVGFFRDLRERERAARALATAEALTRHIVDTAEAAILGLDRDGRVVLFNPYAERLTGWTRSELEVRDWVETLCPRARLPECWQVLRAMAQEGRNPPGPAQILDREGREHAISWACARVSDGDLPVRTICIGIDVTEQQRAEQQLRQAEKLQAIGQLAGGIAHDFNNQLQVIGSLADLLLADGLDERNRGRVEAIRAACRRSADLTVKLLAFSRKAAIKRAPVSVRRLVDETVAILERGIDKRIVIERSEPEATVTIIGDAGSLEHALLNLALNARDAMPDGGTIRFEVDLVEDDAAKPDRWCRIAVRDTGCGIPAELRERIFDPFVTTKPIGEGTGLGLAAVYGTVQEHGGTVEVESTPGAGSCFSILLPANGDQGEVAPSAALGAIGPATAYRILLVDDDHMVREVIAEGLHRAGHAVSAFESGERALAWLDRDAAPLDLALVDLNMPGMGGLDLIRALHQRRCELPIVVGTGLGPSTIDAYIRDHPLVSVLCKPFRMDELAAHIQQRLAPDRDAGS